MNDNNFNLSDFVEREPNIWACIYRGINRKKDNNEYDEEEEYSGFMMMHSMNDTALNSFQEHFGRRGSLVGLPLKQIDLVKEQVSLFF